MPHSPNSGRQRGPPGPRPRKPSSGTSAAPTSRRRLRNHAGDTLIEVLISALLIAAIVIATVIALNTSNRASALGRARTEAQALAEQDQERLRAEPLATLAALNGATETRPTLFVDGTTFTTKASVLYVTASGANDCTIETPTAGLYKTTSVVTWAGMGKNAPVSDTSAIAPPPGATLVVRIEGPVRSEGLEGVTVTATGPGAAGPVHTATTNGEGCTLFGPYEEGGEYLVNAYRTGYVDANSYSQLKEDPSAHVSLSLLTNQPTKASYQLAAAESLKVNLQTAKPTGVTGSWSPKSKVNNIVISTAEGMVPAWRTLLATSTLREGPFTSVAPGLYPFNYAVWAGTCKSGEPAAFGAAHNPEAAVQAGGSTEVTLVLPALVLKIYKGIRRENTELVTSPTVYLTNSSCEEGRAAQETLGSTEKIVEGGVLASPGVPYGKYAVCTQWGELTEVPAPPTTTTTATLTTTSYASGAPIVTKQPIAMALVEGEAIVENAEASGATSQQWEISFNGGSTWAVLNGATYSPYNFGGSYVAQNNALFRDKFTNSHGSTLTNTALLTVTAKAPMVTSTATYHLESTQVSVPVVSQTIQEVAMFHGNATERKTGTC
jgi:Tfp pilus assembly protein PilV